jgi:hypothetical protein
MAVVTDWEINYLTEMMASFLSLLHHTHHPVLQAVTALLLSVSKTTNMLFTNHFSVHSPSNPCLCISVHSQQPLLIVPI